MTSWCTGSPDSSLGLRSVLAPPHAADGLEAHLRSAGRSVDLFVAPRAVLEELTGFMIYQGILGAGRGAATGIVGRPALGPRADEALLVIMPPGRRRFLFEQAGPE